MKDLENLTNTQVNKLIKDKKNPVEVLKFDEIYSELLSLLIPGIYKDNTIIFDKDEDIEYILHVFQSPLPDHFSIGIRFKSISMTLIRFDFGSDLRHKNNYGQTDEYCVTGPHVHVYSSDLKHEPKNVTPLSAYSDFKNINIIKEAFTKFLNYTNIKDLKPNKEDLL
ncbi:hypothetical protein PAF15_01520 [Weissella koreensis]|uniref:DUF6978 family protein n=1 Tax=Weissella koreensis TaxID=165096 RepID=UPI0022BA3331|nr:hypothetical protein [Weissella koreensis]MCZ9310655.1 hypothetical protein [Weissella koreensis]